MLLFCIDRVFLYCFVFCYVILHCLDTPELVDPFTCWGHLDCFQFCLLPRNLLLIYFQIFVQVFLYKIFMTLQSHRFHFSWVNTQEQNSWVIRKVTFNFKSCQTLFQNNCISLPSHQQYTRVPIVLRHCKQTYYNALN